MFWAKRYLLPGMSKENLAKEKTARRILLLAAVLGGAGVALGAFGAHGLQKLELPPKGLEWWGTAVDYLFVHALALFGLAVWMRAGGRGSRGAVLGWLVGVVLFSGSLLAMTLGAPRGLGAVAPIGGTAFIVGWIFLAVAACRGGEKEA